MTEWETILPRWSLRKLVLDEHCCLIGHWEMDDPVGHLRVDIDIDVDVDIDIEGTSDESDKEGAGTNPYKLKWGCG